MKYSNIALLIIMVASPMLYSAVSKDDKEQQSKSKERRYPPFDARNYPRLLGPKSYHHNAWKKGSLDEKLAIINNFLSGDPEYANERKLEELVSEIEEKKQVIADAQELIGDGGTTYGERLKSWHELIQKVQEIINKRQARHAKRKQMAPAFKNALEDGDSEAVAQYLLNDKEAIRSVDECGNTPLMVALKQERLSKDSIHQLIRAMPYAQFSVVNDAQENPLHILAMHAEDDPQAPQIMLELLAMGISVTARDKFGSTPLQYVRRADVANELLKHSKIDVNSINNDGHSVFFNAISYATSSGGMWPAGAIDHRPYTQKDKEALLEVLLKKGADINQPRDANREKYIRRQTPLQYAVSHSDVPLVKFLLKHRALPNNNDALPIYIRYEGQGIEYKTPTLLETAVYNFCFEDLIIRNWNPNRIFDAHLQEQLQIIKLLVGAGEPIAPVIEQMLAKLRADLAQPLAKDAIPKQQKAYAKFKEVAYDLLDFLAQRDPQYKTERRQIEQDLAPLNQPKEVTAMVAEYALGPTDERKKVLNRIKGIIQDSVSNDADKIKKANEELEKLINEDPNYLIELKDETGYTPLHMAVHANALGVVKRILGFAQVAKGPGSPFLTKLLDATTINGLTPLQLAHYLENKAMIHELEWAQKNLQDLQMPAPVRSEPSEDDKAGMSELLG